MRKYDPELKMVADPQCVHTGKAKTAGVQWVDGKYAVLLHKRWMGARLEMRCVGYKRNAKMVKFAVIIGQVQVIPQLSAATK